MESEHYGPVMFYSTSRRAEFIDIEKHSSLLSYGLNYDRKKFYLLGSKGLHHKTFLALMISVV
jgi:hypothetical protein